MSFRTLRFGDRTISYDAGLNLAESQGKLDRFVQPFQTLNLPTALAYIILKLKI